MLIVARVSFHILNNNKDQSGTRWQIYQRYTEICREDWKNSDSSQIHQLTWSHCFFFLVQTVLLSKVSLVVITGISYFHNRCPRNITSCRTFTVRSKHILGHVSVCEYWTLSWLIFKQHSGCFVLQREIKQ